MRSKIVIAAAFSVVAVMGIGSASASAATEPTTTEQKPATYNVTVQPGDTLDKIGQANGATYVRLYNANPNINDPDLIYVGESLRVPAPDEQLPERPMPNAAPAAAVVTPVAPKATQTAPKKATYKPAPSKAAPVASGGVWDRLAQCESGGNWSINTGNGYYGGLQFSASSWRAVGGSGLPSQASREEQIARGEMLLARQGWGAWPSCSSKLGLR